MASTTDDSKGISAIPSPIFSTAQGINSSSPSIKECRIQHACCNYVEDDYNDASLDLKQPCHGWPALVNVMVENPGFESFQAFRDLNLKSLLYYQAELVQLRKELHEIEWQDHRKGADAQGYCSNIRRLLLTERGSVEDQKQLNKIKEIREVLGDYSKTSIRTTRFKILSLIMVICNRYCITAVFENQ